MPLTTEQIHAAADQIHAQGDRPTLARVRAFLGGGSFTTISEAMQSWRQQQVKEQAFAEVDLPATLEERGKTLLGAFWQAAIEDAERRLSAERERLHEAQERLSSELDEAREAMRTLEAEGDSQAQQLEQLRRQCLDAEAIAKKALSDQRDAERQHESQLARMEEKVEGLTSRLSDAADARKQAEAREAAAAQDAKKLSQLLESNRSELGKVQRDLVNAQARADERAQLLHFEQEARQQEVKSHQEALERLESEAHKRLERVLADARQSRDEEALAHAAEVKQLRAELEEARGHCREMEARCLRLEAELEKAHRSP